MQLTDGYVVIKGRRTVSIGLRINALRSASTTFAPKQTASKIIDASRPDSPTDWQDRAKRVTPWCLNLNRKVQAM